MTTTAGVPELLGPDTLLFEISGNTLTLLTIGAPLIMQAMHPMVGAAVDRYSVVRTDPYGRAIRSLDSIALWIYGGPAAIEEGERLRRLHRPLTGVDDQGRRFSALNPEAYAWVHGTIFAWWVRFYPLAYGRRLTDAEEDQLYREILRLGRILQVPDHEMPPDRDAYWAYYRRMLRTRLENQPSAGYVLNELIAGPPPPPFLPAPLRPLWPVLGAVAGRVTKLCTVGCMPSEVRDLLGQRWTRFDEARLRLLFILIRAVHRRLPERLRYLPLAVHARRHAREIDAIHRRARTSFVS